MEDVERQSALLAGELQRELNKAFLLAEGLGIVLPAPLALSIAMAALEAKYPGLQAVTPATLDLFRGDLEPTRDIGRQFLAGDLAKKPRTRKKTKRDKAMSKGLREAQAKARKKNGAWKKGWDQRRVMKEAHRLARKYGPSTKKGQVRKTARRAYRRR